MTTSSEQEALTMSERPLRGAKVGRYRLAFEIASGGMATVFMACVDGPGGFDKIVALKRIHSHLAKEKNYIEMFLDEARIASRIQHSNVCPVTDFGEENGEYYLAMDFLVGVPLGRVIKTLARRVETKPVPPRWPAIATKLLTDAAEGLHAAHEVRGPDGLLLDVVHRDVSPQNLMVGFDGVVRVVDFGVAKAADKLHQTATAELKGKVAYMAPEQMKQGIVDRRTDVWALGVVLWETISLRRLFRRSQQAETMYAILEGTIPKLSTVIPGVPTTLDDAISRALDRDIKARTPDARTFSREISQAWTDVDELPADSVEVEQLMIELFPGERERLNSLVEVARLSKDEVPRVNTFRDPTSSFSGLHDEEAKTLVDGQSETGSQIEAFDWSSRRKVIFAIVALIVLLGGGFSFWMLGRDQGSNDNGNTTAALSSSAGEPVPPPSTNTAPPPAAPNTTATEGDAEPDRAADSDASLRSEDVEDESTVANVPSLEQENGTEAQRRAATKTPRISSTPDRSRPMPRKADSTESPANPAPVTKTGSTGSPERQPAEPPAEPAAPREGLLVVVVPGGWANVYGPQGRLLGVTPLRRPMPAGRHQLSLRFFGEPPSVNVAVDVPPDGRATVSRRAPGR